MSDTILERCAVGEISPEIALAQLLLTGKAPDPARLAADANSPPLHRLAGLAEQHRDRLPVLAALAATGFDPVGEDQIAATAALFDRLAEQAPEAAVAFYSFGDEASLVAVTAELVAVIHAWAPGAMRVLDLGCGIGRVARALAGRTADVLGLDVSTGMIAAAERRGGDARYQVNNGRDLAGIASGSRDLVLAADSWPFLVRAGAAVVDRMVGEAARVLTPGGDLVVFNWSYRGDPAQDEHDARSLAERHGFAAIRIGERPFRIWDGVGFQLRRR